MATWNVNGLRARLEFVLDWLRFRRPDVVGLQELKLADEQFPHAAFEAEGYRAVVHGQKSWNGVAILTRTAAELERRGLAGQDEQGARMLTARVGPLSFGTIYAPNGKHTGHADFPRKLAWFEALQAHLEQHHDAGRPLLLCGDFNVCPAGLDSWDEERLRGTIFHTADERERIRRLLEWGLHDLLREVRPEDRVFSWWDYRAGAFHRGQGLRIDLLLGTRELLPRLRTVEIDREYRKKKGLWIPSDHAPVVAELDL